MILNKGVIPVHDPNVGPEPTTQCGARTHDPEIRINLTSCSDTELPTCMNHRPLGGVEFLSFNRLFPQIPSSEGHTLLYHEYLKIILSIIIGTIIKGSNFPSNSLCFFLETIQDVE